MKNLHKVYYKDYFAALSFKESDEEQDSQAVSQRTSSILQEKLRIIACPVQNCDTFMVKVLYPGLVTGVGLSHEAGVKGEAKLGFQFDYTYGMPVIPGSSVKGVLRSYFKEFYKEADDADNLFKEIFGSPSHSGMDVFFDAVVVKAPDNKPFLATDAITPHGNNPFAEPVPITFLKIAPGSVIEFRFLLQGDRNKKLSLFRQILTTVGIGAKTNVGYGQLEYE